MASPPPPLLAPPILTLSESAQLPSPLPLRVPWGSGHVYLGQGFDSRTLTLKKGSPFDKSSPSKAVFEPRTSGTNSCHRVITKDAASSSEHVDGRFHGSIGNALAGASGQGTYMKALADDRSAIKASTRVSIRTGSVAYGTIPDLHEGARKALRNLPNAISFQDTYGDFYVGGLIIGADNGVFAAFSSDTASSAEALHVRLEGHFLGFGGSKTIDKLDAASSADCDVKVDVFDSLWKRHETTSFSRTDADRSKFNQLRDLVATYQSAGDRLLARLEELDAAGRWRHEASHEWMQSLVDGGAIAELLLVPYANLREMTFFKHKPDALLPNMNAILA